MSLILDALNRSSQNTDQIPGVATQHYVEDSAGGNHGRQYLPWLALLVSLLVIGWLVLDRVPPPSSQAPPAMTAPAATSTPPAELHAVQAVVPIVRTPEPDTMEAQQPSSTQSQPVTELTLIEEETVAVTQLPEDNSAVADLYRKQAASAIAPATIKPAVQLEAESATRSSVAPAVTGRPAAADVAESGREEQPIDIEKMVLKARNDLKDAQLEEHSAPFITELSQHTKDGIPTFFYERHDYSDIESQSSVVCSGKLLKVGDSSAAGIKVDEILPDSVVLSYGGTQFRLRALNSWVNL